MPYAVNAIDHHRVYFEDDGGVGPAVVMHGGIVDSVEAVRDSHIAGALSPDEFRLIYVDHRGVGRSDKPHDVMAYAMPLRVADAVAVLDALDIERAHFVGTSYGGRLCFGIGEHASARVRSLIIGGQQPFAMDADSPLGRLITESLALSRANGSMNAFVDGLERYWGFRFPDRQRELYLDNDPAAIESMSNAMLAEGTITGDLRTWRMPCVIFVGARDTDFVEGARRAAHEIPNAQFITLEGLDHLDAHFQQDPVLPAVLRTLRGDDVPRATRDT